MLLNKILRLGNPLLYKPSQLVQKTEVASLRPSVDLLHQLIQECQNVHGFGRGIAAPQIGVLKRVVCLRLAKDERYTLYNPVITELDPETVELWDDCMSFPDLLVRVRRHASLRLTFLDADWNSHTWDVDDFPLSELLQHEVDHLDGILATQRAVDNKSFRIK